MIIEIMWLNCVDQDVFYLWQISQIVNWFKLNSYSLDANFLWIESVSKISHFQQILVSSDFLKIFEMVKSTQKFI